MASIIIYIAFPFLEDPIFWKKYILTSINLQWLSYILLSGIFLYNHIKKLPAAKEKLNLRNIWLISLLSSVLILWSIYFFIRFEYFVIGAITFSAFFYLFFLYFIFNEKKRIKVFSSGKRYNSKKIDNSTEVIKLKGLTDMMNTEKLYKNSNLKLRDLAELLDMSSHNFSQLLNDNLGKNFSEFISEYRIEEAKQLIQSNSKYTLDAIGKESGFNSKSIFYKHFKSITGMTPKKYKESFLSS